MGIRAAEPFLELSVFSLARHAERDAFDTLFDHAPDKLNLVKKVDDLTPQAAPPPTGPVPIQTLSRLFADKDQGRPRWG